MSQRMERVNRLVREELGQLLRRTYQAEAVAITITQVDVSPDLRHAKVFYSVIGDPLTMRKAGRFLNKKKKDIRFRLGKRIVLKYMPDLEFVLDRSIEKGTELLEKMDAIEEEDMES